MTRTAVATATPQLHPKTRDLTGQRYGRLTVETFAGYRAKPSGDRDATWKCQCDCGANSVVLAASLRVGDTTSCGCGKGKCLAGRSVYATWRSMLARTTNPNNKRYADYGGRGIRVCDRWRNDFAAFLADMGERPEGMTLDRIDNNGDYEPGNVRWASRSDQDRNKRNNRWIEYAGVRLVMADWADQLGLPRKTLRNRLDRHGWPAERALTERVDPARLAAVLAEYGTVTAEGEAA